MARCRVVRGGWTWQGVQRQAGDVLTASPTQVKAWVRGGYVEPVIEPKPKPERVVETAEAAPPPENAAKRTKKPRARSKK